VLLIGSGGVVVIVPRAAPRQLPRDRHEHAPTTRRPGVRVLHRQDLVVVVVVVVVIVVVIVVVTEALAAIR